MSIITVTDKSDVEMLAEGLLGSERNRPWCLISTTDPLGASPFDLEQLKDAVGDICDLWLISDKELTFYLGDLLPERTNVYANAARVYPVGFNRDSDPHDSPRFIADELRIKQQQAQLESAIWKLADVGKFKSEREQRSISAKATVKSVFPPSIALLQLADGKLVTVRQELCFPGVPIDWVLAPGDEVSGSYDSENGDFIPDGVVRDVAAIVKAYGYGNVILGLVKSAARQDGLITICPGIDLPITRDEISGNPRDLVSDFLDEGDVVAVRLYRDPQGRTRLRMDDINDDEIPLEALPVIAEGVPWLVEGRVQSAEATHKITSLESVVEEPVELEPVAVSGVPNHIAPESPIVAPAPRMTGRQKSDFEHEIAVHKQAIARMHGELKVREAELMELNRDLADAAAETRRISLALSEERKKNTATKRLSVRVDSGKSTTASRRSRWKTDPEWFYEELRRAWIGRYKPADRDVFKLDLERIAFGPVFFKSLRAQHIGEDDLRKCVRVILDIVTERNAQDRIHEVHPLREGAASSAANLTREDGAVCLRAYLEENTPQAKRLHFWKSPGGYELSRVGLHDDLRS